VSAQRKLKNRPAWLTDSMKPVPARGAAQTAWLGLKADAKGEPEMHALHIGRT